jgi:iron complex transport system permease protein
VGKTFLKIFKKTSLGKSVFLLAQRQGRISSTRLILAGVAISYLFSAVTSFLTLKAGSGDAARRVLFGCWGDCRGQSGLI